MSLDVSLSDGAMPKIALVLPVYRAIPYLQACLDSILAQTYGNFTVFAIDDGSPDASGNGGRMWFFVVFRDLRNPDV